MIQVVRRPRLTLNPWDRYVLIDLPTFDDEGKIVAADIQEGDQPHYSRKCRSAWPMGTPKCEAQEQEGAATCSLMHILRTQDGAATALLCVL